MTLTLDFSRSLLKVGVVGLIDVKQNGAELIRYLANCMTLPFAHTHDLMILALSQEWEGWLIWNESDVTRPWPLCDHRTIDISS